MAEQEIRARVPLRRTCGTMDVHRRLLIRRPGYAEARARIENHALSFRRFARLKSASAQTVRITVVVHIVHHTPEQNISAEQVASQIAVLNRDYRAINVDKATVPSVFAGLAADAKIEFALAMMAPDGSASDGTTRTYTETTAFIDDDAMKDVTTGGNSAWPADRYLNIWVCDLGDLLGYAQFPGGPPETDGVVIHYAAFGTTGTAQAPFNLGRTATHEIGHWLNLYHVWGDDGFGCAGTDQVDDTPNQGGPNYGVPIFPKVTCNNGPSGDMFMNFMDYSDDAALVMFTSGQVARMRACLEGERAPVADATSPTPEEETTPVIELPVETTNPVVLPARAGSVVTSNDGALSAFVIGPNRELLHRQWDGYGWVPEAGYENLGRKLMTAAEAVSPGPGRLDVFCIGTNRALYHKWRDNAGWHPSLAGFEPLGGEFRSGPSAASWSADRIDVFVAGIDSAVYHKWWNGAAWMPQGGFENLHGICMGTPCALAREQDRLDVFILGPDSAIWHKWWDGAAWQPSQTEWASLGGRAASVPRAVSLASNRLDVFMINTESALCHKYSDGTSWQPSPTEWEVIGSAVLGTPEAISQGTSGIDVFAVGTDGTLRQKTWNGASWVPPDTFISLGSVCTSSPRAATLSAGRTDVFVVDATSSLSRKSLSASAPLSSTSGWETLPGIVLQL